MEYDVFISCKREDYPIAERLYRYLKDNGFYVFLSSMELRRLKDSEYMDAISEAIDSAYHLIVLGSSKENIMSKWVKFEWATFLNEQLSGRKDGQIMTYVDGGLTIANLPIQLRHYESFTSQNYKGNILHYVETPAYLKRKEEAERQAKLEAEKARSLKEAEQRRNRIKNEIKDKEAEYYRHAETLKVLAQEIADQHKLIGENTKTCPVCNQEVDIDTAYCKKCGWAFTPLFATIGKSTDDHLFISRSNWNNLKKQSDTYEREVAKLKDLLKESDTIKEDLLHELSEKDKQYNAMKKDLIDNLDKQQIKYDAVKDSNSKLQSQIESLQEKVRNLSVQLESALNAPDSKNKNTKFIVRLTDVGSNKLQLVLALRDSLGVGLKEAKDLADNVPTDLPGTFSFDEKENVCRYIEEAGGRCEARFDADENEKFIVRLTDVGSFKLQLVLALRDSLGVGLKEAKDLADNVPTDLPGTFSFDEKESVCRYIEEAGGAYKVRKTL